MQEACNRAMQALIIAIRKSDCDRAEVRFRHCSCRQLFTANLDLDEFVLATSA